MKGATVIIANTQSAPATTVHPGLFFAKSGQESEPIAAGQFDWNPDKSPSGPVSLIVSSADKTVYVYRNGVEIGRAGVPNPQVIGPLNDLVFTALQGTDADGHLRWAEVTATGDSKSNENIFFASQKSGLPAPLRDKAKAVITPGATIIFTDRPVDPTTQSPPNFQILVAQKDKPSVQNASNSDSSIVSKTRPSVPEPCVGLSLAYRSTATSTSGSALQMKAGVTP